MRIPSSQKKNSRYVLHTLLLFSLLTFALADLDYCSVTKPRDTIGLLNNQSLSLTLGDYIRGYDLEFTSDKAINARPSNPLNSIGSVEFNFQQGYKIVNSDVNKCNCGRWFQQGVVFAQKDTKNIGLVLTKFTGTRTVADVLEHQYYTLDVPAVCFSARIVDADYNVVLDCQTTDPNDQSDMLCFISTKEKKVKSCLQLDSLNDVKDRKSEIMALNGEMFLVTGSYSRSKDSDQMTYLTVYHIDTVRGMIDFSNIIDGYQLGFDYDLIISDFEVKLGGKIYINDLAKSQMLTVKYTRTNQIRLLQQPWVYGSEGVEFQVSNVNSILIASKAYVQEFDLTLKARIMRYQLPKTDNEVNSVSVSTYGLIVTTQKGSLYVYQRIMTPANYILGSMELKQNNYLLSPYTNILYIFSEKQYGMIEMTSGSLSISGITEPQNITVTAKSSTSTCSFTLEIISVESTTKILTKQNINNKQYTTESDQVINFNLEQIFSGQNLRYNVPLSNDQVKYSLQHLNQFTVVTELKDANLRQIVALDKNSFLQLGLFSTQAYLELCVANNEDMKIICKNVYSGPMSAKNPNLVAGKLRKSGQAVFVWTAPQTQHEVLCYTDGVVSGHVYMYNGVDFGYSSIVIAQDKIYLVLKQYGMIGVFNDLSNPPTYFAIDAKSFAVMNKDLIGFYPRELYLHPRNNELIYVKFPRHVCLMTIFGTDPKAIDCVQVLDKIIPEQDWTVIVGSQTYVVITPNKVSEYSILGNGNTAWHTITVPDLIMPVYYNQFLNTAIMKTTSNQMIYYKLNKPTIDCIYFQTQVQNSLKDSQQPISAEGYWSVDSLSMKAYRQSYNSMLSIEIIGDRKSFKESLNISLYVYGSEEQIEIDDNITVINYRTQIKAQNETNDVIKMPYSAAQTVKIPININDYFNGPRANYHLMCDFCDDTIKIETLFQNKQTNPQIQVSARSIIPVFGNFYVLLTSDNMLHLMNKNDKLAPKISVQIQNVKQCQQLAWNQKLGLIVFCTDADGQQIVQFTVTQTSITQWPSSYQLHEQSMITSISQIVISQVGDTQSYWVLVHDHDNSVSSMTKIGNIKAFLLNNNNLEFKGIVSSMTFNPSVSGPISDIEVKGKIVMVTLGNFGLGYGWLADNTDGDVMTNIGSVELGAIEEIKGNLLDNSVFQQVQVLSAADSTFDVLVTSSTSIPMVLTMTLTGNTFQFAGVKQTYNRYGQMETLNWHAVNSDILLLKYYNSATLEQYIVGYPRKSEPLNDFIGSMTRKLSPQSSTQNIVFLNDLGHLIVSEIGDNNTPQLSRYQVSTQFNLLLSYQQPGDFSSITMTSSNTYSSDMIEIPVQFDNKGDDSGVKWYTIMIIVLIVAIICGVAYGMYLKMMKNRKSKKVSLLTQGQQVDEQI